MGTKQQKRDLQTVSINLPSDILDAIKKIAKHRNLTMTDAICRAVVTESYIEDEIKNGGTILVKKPDGAYKEVVFR
ncbi:MAG: hypothetical protein BRC41_19360 [Cyanobacteria bacterium QH_9_48_43]|nr:MAG: hypothetical protein BRC41_19360 [Cyanobacteria bacterium QH_9_48_43]